MKDRWKMRTRPEEEVVAGVVVDISMSLDGFVAGPDDGLGSGLG
jgi:hypothetical protein